MDITQINIKGMTCAACVNHVEKAATSIEGVISAEVNLDNKELTLIFAEDKNNLVAVKDAVTAAGYTVS